MSLLAWQDGVETSLHSVLERAGAVITPRDGAERTAHFGSPAGELAGCCHAVGVLVTEHPRADDETSPTVSFELLGRRVEKVIRDLAELRPELEWARPSNRIAITSVPADDALTVWLSLVRAGRCHELANVGSDSAARFRMLESGHA